MNWLNCDFHYYVADWSVGVIHFWLVYLDGLYTFCLQPLQSTMLSLHLLYEPLDIQEFMVSPVLTVRPQTKYAWISILFHMIRVVTSVDPLLGKTCNSLGLSGWCRGLQQKDRNNRRMIKTFSSILCMYL
jgi:hypothetical protein